jgi:hypothetical protein
MHQISASGKLDSHSSHFHLGLSTESFSTTHIQLTTRITGCVFMQVEGNHHAINKKPSNIIMIKEAGAENDNGRE